MQRVWSVRLRDASMMKKRHKNAVRGIAEQMRMLCILDQ